MGRRLPHRAAQASPRPGVGRAARPRGPSTANICLDDEVQQQLRNWLERQYSEADHVLIKDPRLSWFLPLWQRCAEAIGVSPRFVTMLRHPAAVVDSKQRSYGGVAGRRLARRRLAQPDALHRARDARRPARARPLRRRARGLDEDGRPHRRGARPGGRARRPGGVAAHGARVRRPLAEPLALRLGRPRAPGAAADAGRRGVGADVRARRRRGRDRPARRRPRRLHRPLRRGRGDRAVLDRGRPPAWRRPGQPARACAPRADRAAALPPPHPPPLAPADRQGPGAGDCRLSSRARRRRATPGCGRSGGSPPAPARSGTAGC